MTALSVILFKLWPVHFNETFTVFFLMISHYRELSHQLSWLTSRLISALFPPVSSDFSPNSVSKTLMRITHTVIILYTLYSRCSSACSVFSSFQNHANYQKRPPESWLKKMMYSRAYLTMLSLYEVQTFKAVSLLSITSLARSNIFGSSTCVSIMSLILCSMPCPLHAAASTIRQKKSVIHHDDVNVYYTVWLYTTSWSSILLL